MVLSHSPRTTREPVKWKKKKEQEQKRSCVGVKGKYCKWGCECDCCRCVWAINIHSDGLVSPIIICTQGGVAGFELSCFSSA